MLKRQQELASFGGTTSFATMASASGKLMSAEERRRAKELEEARKAGLAAPEVSRRCRTVVENGRERWKCLSVKREEIVFHCR